LALLLVVAGAARTQISCTYFYDFNYDESRVEVVIGEGLVAHLSRKLSIEADLIYFLTSSSQIVFSAGLRYHLD